MVGRSGFGRALNTRTTSLIYITVIFRTSRCGPGRVPGRILFFKDRTERLPRPATDKEVIRGRHPSLNVHRARDAKGMKLVMQALSRTCDLSLSARKAMADFFGPAPGFLSF